jgi:N-acetylmuramoyl-L-alanine amidase
LTRSLIVQSIQRRLKALGYAPGSDDGVYGPQTAHAITAFQADRGLVADGEVGPRTRKELGV